jgi:hypothetical protein
MLSVSMKKTDIHFIHFRSLRAGRVAQVVERLPSKHEALSSNSCTTKNKK